MKSKGKMISEPKIIPKWNWYRNQTMISEGIDIGTKNDFRMELISELKQFRNGIDIETEMISE